MKHLTLLDRNVAENGTLIKRNAGRYFTPLWLASSLATKILKSTGDCDRLNIVDPFCGDGRLVITLLKELSRSDRFQKLDKVNVDLWDNSKENIQSAKEAVQNCRDSLSFRVKFRSKVTDSFFKTRSSYGKYDVVITNPPWETLKPDSRELRHLSQEMRSTVSQELRDYDNRLAKILPNSQPVKKLYGWGTNLSRCGLELSINLLTNSGICGIVLPSTLYGDQLSTKLREWLFTQVRIESVDHYPAEARLFKGVDQPVIMSILRKAKSPERSKVVVTRHNRNKAVVGTTHINLNHHSMNMFEFRIPTDLTTEEFEVQKRLANFPILANWEVANGGQLWMGRELDETNYKSFVSSKGNIPFVKGRDIHRFNFVKARGTFLVKDRRKLPRSMEHRRLAWRDVSRRSQVRRMLATLIPEGFVTGNSLNVGYFVDADAIKLKALLGIFNSLIFEFQLRTRLATGHVSLGSVRGIHIPDFDDKKLVNRLATLVDRVMDGDLGAEATIDSLVADALGLTANEKNTILSHFNGLSEPMREVFDCK